LILPPELPEDVVVDPPDEVVVYPPDEVVVELPPLPTVALALPLLPPHPSIATTW
jgi:hypothetical protein